MSCLTDTGRYAATPATNEGMEKGLYLKHIIDTAKPLDPDNGFFGSNEYMTRLLWMDQYKVADAPYMEAVWFLQTLMRGPDPHTHDFPEFLGFMSADPENPYELGATVEFWVGDEKLSFDRSCLIFVAEGVKHSPLLLPDVRRPIIHFSGGPGRSYNRLK